MSKGCTAVITLILAVPGVVLGSAAPAAAQLDQLLKGIPGISSTTPDNTKLVAGLKEALQVGTQNAVSLTGKPDGYYRNTAIKIQMPEQLRTLEAGLRGLGYGSRVDEFVLGMNRAAEHAAPAAKPIFLEAITGLKIDDATKILHGGDTAATDYFKTATSDKLTTAFSPIVERAMNEVAVARQYNELIGQARNIPFFRPESYDINHYVVGKSLDGLFHVLGDEERKIRTNPTARVTDLLKEVFGGAR
jgi:hypothetical protein